MTVLLLTAMSLSGPARAQSDADEPPVILLHPGIATILRFSDDIADAWLQDGGEIRVARVGNEIALRPRAGTPAGVEGSLDVKTKTGHRIFRLRVVKRARDAHWDIVVWPTIPTDLLAPPAVGEPPASVATSPPPEPPIRSESLGEPAAPITAAIPAPIPSPRPEISMHAIGSLGFTALDIASYEPFIARQPHLGLGVRFRVTRPGAWWALEANIMGELPGGSMTYGDDISRAPLLAMSGPWLRAEAGTRALFGGTKWSPSVYVGLGVQAHLRRTGGTRDTPELSETMPRGPVLVLGVGLQRRSGDLLLGLDFQWREGGPDHYHSGTMLWTAGFHLDPD